MSVKHARRTLGAMRTIASNLQVIPVAIALLRGIGEFATLQRWRLKAWITR